MKTIGIYHCNSQPPTVAHADAYKKLKRLVGEECFVTITDKTPTPDAPLNFGDKQQLWTRHGVPLNYIIKLEDWSQPHEIFAKFSKEHTSAIFMLNHNEFESLKNVWTKHGKSAYFQSYQENKGMLNGFDKNAYVIIVDDSKIHDKPISTANIIEIFGSDRYDSDRKKRFFQYIFGFFDIGLYHLVISKYTGSHSTGNRKESVMENKNQIQKMVYEVLNELIGEDYSSIMSTNPSDTMDNSSDTSNNTTDTTQQSLTQQRSDATKQKTQLVKQKKELEAKSKQNKQQRDGFATTVKNYDTFQKKTDRDALDSVNSQLSQQSSAFSSN